MPNRVHRAIVCFCDGHATCQGAAPEPYRGSILKQLSLQGDSPTPVHVVAGPGGIDDSARFFLQALAERTGGVYVRIIR